MDPRVTAFVGTIVRSGVVPRTARPALASEIARTTRWNDAWLTEAACVAIAVLFSVSASRLHLSGTTAAVDLSRGASPAALWYWMVCLTIVRFLIIRWLLRLAFWSHFIWRLTRLGLHLVPTHPDGVGGLGYLEVVHLHFTPLVFAISAVQSAGLAEELATQATTFTAIYPALALVLIVDAVLFLGPLLIVGPTLWACKVKGLIDYMEFAETYVRTFDTKWVAANTVNEEPLLGTSDLQSLADLNNSLATVRNMRVAPVTIPLVRNLAMAACLPMLPLLLFKYPLVDLAEKFFTRLTGL